MNWPQGGRKRKRSLVPVLFRWFERLRRKYPDINTLSAAGLMTVDGDGVVAGPERRRRLRQDVKFLIFGDELCKLCSEDAVEINFRVFIVENPEFYSREVIGSQREFCAKPNVIGFP